MKNIVIKSNVQAPMLAQLRVQLLGLDWSAPWWKPWRDVGQRVAQRIIAGKGVAAALNDENAVKHFVPQTAIPEGAAYEQFIFDTQQVPTRDNLHDFFNGLAWIVFPQTKQKLNALQANEIKTHGVQATRGPLRDALTVFDENAAFMQPSPELVHALQQRQWQSAFMHLRSQWLDQPPILFGHALLEKLVFPYKSVTSHVFNAQAAPNTIANLHEKLHTNQDWDTHISRQLSPQALVPKPFLPLPVLGVPGWWAANEDAAFYDDAQVFRPIRALFSSQAT